MKETLLSDLLSWKNTNPKAIALAQKNSEGKWETYSTSDYVNKVSSVANALESTGFKSGDRALILSRNCSEWLFCDLGVSLVGGLCGGLYNNASEEDFAHAFKLVQPKVLFVEDQFSFERIPVASTKCLEKVIVFRGDASFDIRAMTFESFLASGKEEKSFEDYLSKLDSSKPSFIIFTSGTTGAPKAAMLSHDNIYFAASCYRKRWSAPKEGKLYSFLPASHVAEKVYSLGHGLHFRYPVYFASDLMNVLAEMYEVQPLAFLATPRIWQKIMEKVQLGMRRNAKGLAGKILARAQQLSVENLEAEMADRKLPLLKRYYFKHLDKKVLLPIREKLGLSKAIKTVSGAAALPDNVRTFFRGLGVNIIEAYAQTESAGVLSGQLGHEDCAGTIGFPVPELEVKISDEGELLTRGKHVFCGYLDNPEATKQTIRDGWLHTGDLASWNEKGQIVFVGRKRDIIKPLEGKMIAPAKLEDKLMASNLISQAVVFGDGEKYLVALLTLDPMKPTTLEQAELEVKKYVSQINKGLARHERIQKFRILDREFSLDMGELTPTLKTKRHVVKKHFSSVLDELYGRFSVSTETSPSL